MRLWPAYPAYKDSGVPWLGEIPADWDAIQGRHIGDIYGGCSIDDFDQDDEGTILYIKVNDLNRPGDGLYLSDSEEHVSASTNLLKLPKGDMLLFPKRGAAIFTNKVRIVNSPVLFDSNTMGWMINRDNDSCYIAYALLSRGLTDLADISSVPQINNKHIYPAKFPKPPLPEQRAIAAFLDRETAKLDALTRKFEHLIEVAQEQRAALISHAVTRGLDPDVPLKDSGIPWLGEIPAGWEKSRIKRVCSIKGRIGFRGYTTSDLVGEGEGALTLGATQIDSQGNIDLSSPVFISWEKYYESPEIMVQSGDILIVQRGSTCGKVGIVMQDTGPTTINPSLVLLKEIALSSRFMFYFLSSNLTQNTVNALVASTAIPMISQNQIGNFLIIYPKYNEQVRIAAHLDRETAKLDALVAKAQEAIARLAEYRTALISAAVTGKIDVRDAQ